MDGYQLADLRALAGGDGVFLAALVESFITSEAECMSTFAVAVEAGDAEALKGEAHRFRGEAATLGATLVAALCAELEAMPAPLDRAAAGATLARMEGEMRRVGERLRAEVGTAQLSDACDGLEG